MLPDDALEKIHNCFNQPIVVHVSPPKSNTPPKKCAAAFTLRWYGQRGEVHICGHGTCMLGYSLNHGFFLMKRIFQVAATEGIFRRLNPADKINILEFQTLSGILTAKRVDDKISMELPAGMTIPASTSEAKSVEAAFCRALGKPTVALRYVGHGGPGFKNYLFVEVDVSEELSTWRPEVQYFISSVLLTLSPHFQHPCAPPSGRTFSPHADPGGDFRIAPKRYLVRNAVVPTDNRRSRGSCLWIGALPVCPLLGQKARVLQ